VLPYPEQLPDAGSPDGTGGSVTSEVWLMFHAEVEHLLAVGREVVALTFYHGMTQAEVANVVRMTDRTVRPHWNSV
jgi:DNA-directed RNA polymerase specialized sigma24 family protein